MISTKKKSFLLLCCAALSLTAGCAGQQAEAKGEKKKILKKPLKGRICGERPRKIIDRLGKITGPAGEIVEIVEGFKLGIPDPVSSTVKASKFAHRLLDNRREKVCESGNEKALEQFDNCLDRAEEITAETEKLLEKAKKIKDKETRFAAVEEILGQAAALQETLHCGEDDADKLYDATLGGTDDQPAADESVAKAKKSPVQFRIYEGCKRDPDSAWGPCSQQSLKEDSKIMPVFEVLDVGESLHVYVVNVSVKDGVLRLFPKAASKTTTITAGFHKMSSPLVLDASGNQWEHVYFVASRHKLPALEALSTTRPVTSEDEVRRYIGLLSAYAQYPSGLGTRKTSPSKTTHNDSAWGGYESKGHLVEQKGTEPFAVYRMTFFHE